MKVKPRDGGLYRLDLDRQQVSGLGALDVHGSSQRMDAAHVDGEQLRSRHADLDLTIETVDGLHFYRGTSGDAYRRRNIWVPSIVTFALL